MSHFHAVVWMDHQEAHVLHFDAASFEAHRIKARSHHPRHHEGDALGQALFHEGVLKALDGAREVLLVGPGHAHDEFKAWTRRHHPDQVGRILATEKLDHPSDAQLVALARRQFLGIDRMAGTPTPN